MKDMHMPDDKDLGDTLQTRTVMHNLEVRSTRASTYGVATKHHD